MSNTYFHCKLDKETKALKDVHLLRKEAENALSNLLLHEGIR